ncbi:hypothetical protein DM02DRAFT_608075 [Periconia macrospinosa]|uniref:Uncharacterized protein n=1 Tax=Periconia macrospinosa TaxID=97972 RepID=A0A2V1EGP1_9PLEO|nr:hypothetical protein DM02DRAFT_608075 [Periconia macrospinosa]
MSHDASHRISTPRQKQASANGSLSIRSYVQYVGVGARPSDLIHRRRRKSPHLSLHPNSLVGKVPNQ